MRQVLDALQVAVAELAAGGVVPAGRPILDPDLAIHYSKHSHILLGMARLEFNAEVTVKVPPERAFDYFADYRHVAAVLDGVTRWEPLGRKTRGAGARYDVEMAALGFPLKSVLRLNRWRRPHEIGWISESGLIKQEGLFTFNAVSGGVHIELRIAYEPPASFVGAAIAKRLDPLVKRRLEGALDQIRDKLEAKASGHPPIRPRPSGRADLPGERGGELDLIR